MASFLDRLLRSGRPNPDTSFVPDPVEVADGIWTLERRLRMPGGLTLPSRTTILRDPVGRLLLISPPRLDGESRRQVEALGTIGGVIVPNSFHHLFAQAWLDAFPGIELFAAPGVPDRTGALPTAQILQRENPPDWTGRIETAVLSPPGPFAEVALFHHASATLVLTDLAFHLTTHDSRFAAALWSVIGVPHGLGPSRLVRMTLLRDRPAVRAFLERILEWPFERILVAHGTPIECDARRRLREAFASFLGDSAAEAV